MPRVAALSPDQPLEPLQEAAPEAMTAALAGMWGSFSEAAAAAYAEYLGESGKAAVNFAANYSKGRGLTSTLPLAQRAAYSVVDGRADVIVYGEEAVHVLSVPRLVVDVDVYASSDDVEAWADAVAAELAAALGVSPERVAVAGVGGSREIAGQRPSQEEVR